MTGYEFLVVVICGFLLMAIRDYTKRVSETLARIEELL
jgi:hypothetical protein